MATMMSGISAPSTENPIHDLLNQPIDVRRQSVALKNFAQYLNRSVSNTVGRIRVKDIFKVMGFPIPSTITDDLATDIGKLIEMSCFQFAPNKKLHPTSFELNDIILYTQAMQIPTFSPACDILAIIIMLGSMIARSDANISKDEIQVLQNMVLSRKVLDDEQRASLLLWLHWCLYTPQNLWNTIQDLSQLSQGLREQISHILVKVACADGKIAPKENEDLITLHKAMGFPKTWFEIELSNQLQGGIHIPTVEEVESAYKLESSPMKSFYAHASQNDLETVCISSELNQALSSVCEQASSEIIHQTVKQPETSLDKHHISFLQSVMHSESLPRLKLFELALAHKLMADWAMEQIDQVATQKYQEPIFTDGSIVLINHKVAQQLYRDLSEKP